MTADTTIVLADQLCPGCERPLGVARGLLCGGDVTVCSICATTVIFEGEEPKARKATIEDIAEFPPGVQWEISRAASKVLQRAKRVRN